jgi:hypothetical protein
MSKQIVDIGVQGNDGTGDSIRESFRKVNDNFTELYAIFGVDGAINFTDLSDTPATYTSNQIIMASNSGDKLTARTLQADGAITIDSTNDGRLKFTVGARGVSDDLEPTLAYSLNANGLSVFNVAYPTLTIANELALDYPAIGSGDDIYKQMVITKEFADANYLQVEQGGVTTNLNVRPEPAFPELLIVDPNDPEQTIPNPNYDPTLTGNYLATEAVQRQFVVSRKGDSMSGKLFLSDHPSPLEGYGIPNGETDLQAATKFYVDNQVFSSAVNLYVSQATGDDLQQKTPVGKEGRFWQYAYKTVGAAALAAENLQALANQEPGPYRQRLSYTIGADQYFSTITNVTLQDGNTNVAGYQDAFDLLQANKSFIQAETIAYINNKYVNVFTYDKAKCQRDVQYILEAVGYDLVLNSTFNVNRAATFYFNGTGGNVLGSQLIQTIEAIKYAKQEILNYSYSSASLSTYLGQVIDALCYDLVLQSNYQSIQAGIFFPYAGADISVAQMTELLINLKNKIIGVSPFTTFPGLTPVKSIALAKSSIETNINNIINIISGEELPEVVYTKLPDTSIGQISARDLLVNNIDFLQAETVAYLGAEYPNLTYNKVTCKRDVQYIVWSLIYDMMYGGNSQSVYAGLRYWDNSVQQIGEYEVAPFQSLLTYLTNLIGSIVQSDSPPTVYQQSIKQYRNETFIFGELTLPGIVDNISAISDIIGDAGLAPSVTSPDYNSAAQALKDAYTSIQLNKTLFQTEAISYVGANFPVINDPTILSIISDKFQVVIDLLTYGITTREDSEFTNPNGSSNGQLDANYLAVQNLHFIANEALGYYATNYDNARGTYGSFIGGTLTVAGVTGTISEGQYLVGRGFTQGQYVTAVEQPTPGTYEIILSADPDSTPTGTIRFISRDTNLFKQDIVDCVEAAVYDLVYGGNSASTYKGQQLYVDVNNTDEFLDAVSYAGTILTLNIIQNTAPSTIYSPPTSQFIDAVGYPDGGTVSSALSQSFSYISGIAVGIEGPILAYPILDGFAGPYVSARNIIALNAQSVAIRTTDWLDVTYTGGFNYDEATCYRDVGLIVDAMAIDIITGGTYQSINAGKSYYRNASARAVAIGTQYKETLDAINFAKGLHLQVLSQTSASRFQTLIPQQFDESLSSSQDAIDDLTTNVNTMISIIVGGVGAAPVSTFGTGIWKVEIDNGGNGYVDQGSPGNNDIIAAKVLVGVTSASYGSIVKYIPNSGLGSDTIQVRLTKPGFFELNEQIEFGETVKDNHIVIQVESGIYYEDYPIRVPANVSVRGDEFRRTIMRPRDRISQSPWRKVFFYRDSIIDAMELGPIGYGVDYASNASITMGGTTNKIVVTLNSGQVPSSWVGKILIDDYTAVTATATTITTNVVTTSSLHNFSVGDPVIFRGTTFGNINAGQIYYILTTPTTSSFTLTAKKNSGVVVALTSASGSVLVMRSDRRGKAVIDSVSGNFMNCSVIYPFNATVTYAAGNWHLYTPTNYGRHYLLDPLNPDSEAKNNKDIDVLLTNDAVRVSNLTFQGHGGFSMVLDPEGQVKTKSPYGQVCSSFSQSNNRKRFAGGQFVDGFTGRLRGTITAIEYDGIESFDLNNISNGSGYTPLNTTQLYTSVPLIGLSVSVTNTYSSGNTIKLNTTTNLTAGSAITFSGTAYGGLETGVRFYILTIDTVGNLITISRTQGGTALTLSSAAGGSLTAVTGGTGGTANITVTNGVITNVVVVNRGEYYKEGEYLSASNSNLGGTGSGFKVPIDSTNGKGQVVTVVGEFNSGLDIRPPQPPCAFYVEGSRYQINDIVSFNAATATVVLQLDVATPYNIAGFYDNTTCSRDVGLILDAVTYDLVIGSNYQTIKAGVSYQRATASVVITNQKGQTLAGLNYARDQALLALTDPTSESAVTASMSIINTIIDQGVTAAPAITYPTAGYAATDAQAVKLKDNLIANKTFITSELIAYNAATYNLKGYPDYSSVKVTRDFGYIVDAIVYDIMYSGNSMSYDIAESFYSKLTGVSYISGLQAIYSSAIDRLKVIAQQIALNTTVTKSSGNNATQTITAGYIILNTDAVYTKIGTLSDLVKDYVADGVWGAATRTNPTIASVGLSATALAQRVLVQNAKSTIQSSTINYLNDGGGLLINIEMGGNKSMLANDFAMINDLGYAIVCKNGGISEQVSTFTYYCHTHYWAADGGQIRSVAGSNAHGTYGLRATGYDVTEKPDAVNLAYDMVQVARVYKQGTFASEMTPTVSKQSLAVYIYGYSYIPNNTSELEIDHSMAGGAIVRYEVSSVEHTVVTLSGQNILKLNLSSAGNNGTSSTGLSYTLYDGQQVTIRILQNIKFNNIANVNPTRPSTALQYNDNLADIYRILAYNLNDATGELLANNISILGSDSSFNYYKFTTDNGNLGVLDWDFAIAVTGVSGSGSTVTITFASQGSAPYTVGDYVTVNEVICGGANASAYNGSYLITGCTATQVQFASTTTATYTSGGYVGVVTQGSRVGDNKISVLEISQETVINQINKGTYLFGWHGRSHRVVSYTTPLKIATAGSVVSWTSGTKTLVVDSVSGVIDQGDLVSGTNITGKVYVQTVTAPVSPATTYTIVLDTTTGGGSVSSTPSGTITFGISRNGYLNLDPNPVTNIVGDGTSIPALSYVSKVVPTAGLKFVTYNVAWTPSTLPIADNWYKLTGQTTSAFNYWRQVSNAVSQTTIAVSDVTGLQPGMVVSSLSAGAYIPTGTIIQSIDSTANTFIVAPACWVPAGSSVSSTIVATVSSITITNAGSNYTSAPTLLFTGGSPTVQAIATCTIKNGSIETVTLVSPGYGYVSQPTIVLSYGNGQLTPNLTSSPTVTTTASAGVSTNQITVAHTSDPGTFALEDNAVFTGAIANSVGGVSTGTVLNVTAVASGTLKVGMTLTGTSITAGTYISAFVSGSNGGIGVYSVSNTHLFATGTLTGRTRLSGFTSKTGPAAFVGSISTTTLTVSSLTSGTIAIGQKVSGTGVSANTYITAGSGTSWTVSVSQTVGAGTSFTTSYAVALSFQTQASAPTALKWYEITSSNNPLYNGLYYAVTSTTSAITFSFPYDPGTWNTTITISSFTSKTGSGPYLVTYTIPSQSQIPAVGSWWTVTGNANSGSNGTFIVTAATATTITLSYPADPGSYSTGTTTLTPVVWFAKQLLSATTSQLGISKPFDSGTSATLRLGYPAGAAAQITTRISTCRATGHDFLDIGTGGYSTTNYPYQIYGNPTQSKQQSNEVYEEGVGRVFYVTSDQNGIFRVGRFFTVDQGTGTVTFSASIALSNLDGIGFKRGVVVSEFSTDASLTNNAPEIVPVQSAVRGYIDKRLGLDHGGGPVALSNLIGPGFMALNGSLTMKGNMNMGTFAISNLATPLITDPVTNAANKGYVDTAVAAFDEFKELRDVQWTSLAEGNIPVYDQSTQLNITGGLGTGTTLTFNFATQANAPFPAGSIIVVSTVNPGNWNGTYIVTSCTTSSVSVASTVQTNYLSGGSIVANKWRNIFLPNNATTSDVLLTYSGTTGAITSAIQAGKIVNTMVSATAAIVQSKLAMTAASTRANATSIAQVDLGLASFKSTEFNASSGWISLKDATDTVTGIVYSKLQWQSQSTVLGRAKSAGTGAVGEISFGDVVRDGDGIKNAPFGASGAMTVTYDGSNTLNNSYAVTSITTAGAANSLTKTDASNNLLINNGYINATSLRISDKKIIDINSGTNAVQFYTPGVFNFLSATGTLAANAITSLGGGTLDLTAGTLKSLNLTSGSSATAGTLTGVWSLGSSSIFDARNGTLKTTTLSTGTDTDTGTIQGYWSLSGSSRLQATYADLAEYYEGDNAYRPAMVLVFGGDKEVTTTTQMNDTRLAGVVTTDPAYVMNSEQKGIKVCIALAGRVPCWVVGRVKKGDLLTTSSTIGCAVKANNPTLGAIVGKALEDKDTGEAGIIQIAVGRA